MEATKPAAKGSSQTGRGQTDTADPPAPAAPKGRRIRGLEPDERRQHRRRALLDSALELFANQGYANTSIEQICQNAYVGYKGFYDEFETKEQLFVALYDVLIRRVGDAVLEARNARQEEPDLLRALLGVFVHEVLRDRRVAQVLFIEAAGLSPTVEANRRRAHGAFAYFISASYAEGRLPMAVSLEGESRRFDTRIRRLALGTVGAIAELMVDWLVDPEPDDIEELIDDLERYCHVVLAGLAETT